MSDKEKIEEVIKKDVSVNEALRKHLYGNKQKQEILSVEQYPDHLEVDFGGTGRRGKVYFNASDLGEAKERIKNYVNIEAYKNKLLSEKKEESDE